MNYQNKEEIKTKIKEIIVKDLNSNIKLSDIEDDISLYDDGLGLDSIAIINFIVLLEEKFEFRFEDGEISSKIFNSVNNLVEFIQSRKSVLGEV